MSHKPDASFFIFEGKILVRVPLKLTTLLGLFLVNVGDLSLVYYNVASLAILAHKIRHPLDPLCIDNIFVNAHEQTFL